MNQSLLTVSPGSYMLFEKNEIKRIFREVKGLRVGKRVSNDNHIVVLVDDQLILVPSKKERKK